MNEQHIIEFIEKHWALTSFVVAFLVGVVWLKLDTRYAKKAQLSGVRAELQNLSSRMERVEEDLTKLPTSQDVADLRLSLEEMNGEAKALHTEIRGLTRLVGLLVEKEVSKE